MIELEKRKEKKDRKKDRRNKVNPGMKEKECGFVLEIKQIKNQ